MSKRNRHSGPPQLQQRNTTVVAHRQFIGPLPDPDALAKFDQVLPGLAERIVKMAEGHALDTWRTNRANRTVAIMGQIFAFLLVLVGLAVGTYLTSKGLTSAGIAAIITAIATPIAAILYRWNKKD